MFRRILVANRGEVAARVTRTCRRLGIETVAIASTADRDMAWLGEATRVVCVGGPHPRDSYLDPDAILEVARRESCSALHPGWGFLSENATFAARCEALGVTFIGPPPALLDTMGDKDLARRTMERAGLPVIPGSDGTVPDLETAREEAERIGYPLLVKARAGGGGRGLRLASTREGLEQAWMEASAQASSAFGDGEVYLERFITASRHVEFQILVDRHGGAFCLGDRECSVQRQHQKLLEEAPAPSVSGELRRSIGPMAARALRDAGYVGAGTVEMLLTPGGHLYFMECNARLQVEHPVTEEVTGLDLVELQLKVAAGHRLDLPSLVPMTGHALECRVNAEDPSQGFKPSPGLITRLDLPMGEGIRVDTHLRVAGIDSIPPHYDSLACKIVARGRNRSEALERMSTALQKTRIEGVATTAPLHAAILREPEFREARYDTGFLERRLPRLLEAMMGDGE